MRIIDVAQGSEEWENWGARPTASEFGSFCTPARGDYSKSATDYACKIICKRLRVYVEPPTSFAMDWGTENEPLARAAYQLQTGRDVEEVGFVIPDLTDAYGGSPDGLVGDDGLLEIKCPQSPSLVRYHADGILPAQYKPQVQGLLLITGREWCDFYVWHPYLKPFLLRVMPDEKYQAKIAKNLLLLLNEIATIEEKMNGQPD